MRLPFGRQFMRHERERVIQRIAQLSQDVARLEHIAAEAALAPADTEAYQSVRRLRVIMAREELVGKRAELDQAISRLGKLNEKGTRSTPRTASAGEAPRASRNRSESVAPRVRLDPMPHAGSFPWRVLTPRMAMLTVLLLASGLAIMAVDIATTPVSNNDAPALAAPVPTTAPPPQPTPATAPRPTAPVTVVPIFARVEVSPSRAPLSAIEPRRDIDLPLAPATRPEATLSTVDEIDEPTD